MGTNYYARLDVCKHCGRREKIHIGKSSGGWSFSLSNSPDSMTHPVPCPECNEWHELDDARQSILGVLICSECWKLRKDEGQEPEEL